MQSKNLCGSLTDFIPPVRRVAAESMEKQLTQCRQQLSTLLADDKSKGQRCLAMSLKHVLLAVNEIAAIGCKDLASLI